MPVGAARQPPGAAGVSAPTRLAAGEAATVPPGRRTARSAGAGNSRGGRGNRDRGRRRWVDAIRQFHDTRPRRRRYRRDLAGTGDQAVAVGADDGERNPGLRRELTVVVPPAGSQPPASGLQSGSPSGQQALRVRRPGAVHGTFTWLPSAGQVVSQGQSAYSVNSPVALLYGSVPVYRSLSEGMSGTDVRQLNADLVALGDATRCGLDPGSGYFGAATATALDKLQSSLGLTQTGSLPLGQAVFLPTAVKVSSVSATLGTPAQPGAAVLQATSDTRQVTAQVDATQQPEVTPGARVSVVLPDGRTTPGVVTSVGTAAAAPSGNGSGSSSSDNSNSSGSSGSSGSSAATINVDIRLSDPAAAGTLDQAPVQVNITTATVHDALVVPIDALLAQPAGYAVEVAGANGARHAVPVSLGLFDDADGLVQVTGKGLSAGQQVVVPQL